jgi:hypothetical protein
MAPVVQNYRFVARKGATGAGVERELSFQSRSPTGAH